MSHLRAAAPASKEGDRGRVTLAKVPRHWPGKRLDAPEDAPEVPESQGHGITFVGKQSSDTFQRTPIAPAVITKKADPRLARLAKSNVEEARGEGRQRHRRELQAPVVVRKQQEPEEPSSPNDRIAVIERPGASGVHPSDDGGALAAADETGPSRGKGKGTDVESERQARRERALQAQREAAAREAEAQQASSSEEETEDDSEYTDESSEDEEGRLAKPVFVAKSERETIAERQRAELEQLQLKEEEAKQQAARVKDTSTFVAQVVDLEKQTEAAAAKESTHMMTPSDIDTDENSDDEEEEFQHWIRRELRRVKREEAMRDPNSKELEQRTGAIALASKDGAEKQKFLQRYYHKGAFFQTQADDDRGTVGGDAIYHRSFKEATGEDRFDREALPAVMQVKNFGRAGRTKWKHLSAEDTSVLPDKAAGPDERLQFHPEFQRIREAVERRGAARSGASIGQDDFSKPHRTRT